METADDLKRLYELTKNVQKQLESHFENSEYRPVISMVRRGKEGSHDHGVLAYALGMFGDSHHDHGIGDSRLRIDLTQDLSRRTD